VQIEKKTSRLQQSHGINALIKLKTLSYSKKIPVTKKTKKTSSCSNKNNNQEYERLKSSRKIDKNQNNSQKYNNQSFP
jgi:hypothetical protein